MERAFFKSRAPVGGRDMEFLEDMCKALTAKGTNVYDADFGDVGQLAAGHGISELRHKHVMVKVRIVLMIGESGEEVVKRAKSGGAGRILPSSSERRLIAGTLRKIAPKEAEQRPGLWRAGGGRPERPASQSRGLR
jgi:hypothetical protein